MHRMRRSIYKKMDAIIKNVSEFDDSGSAEIKFAWRRLGGLNRGLSFLCFLIGLQIA